MICQLKALQDCFPSSLRQTLDQLPKSLDDTYVRVLRQIPQGNLAHAHRMLQCIMVAVRPLRVKELAELLAFEFDADQGGIPKYRAAWKLDDQTKAVLSTCSSLVTIVNLDGYPIVQFSHFSVKEFLMSSRLGDFSRYHIHPLSAHTILTQACLGVLLHLDNHVDNSSVQGPPLAEYAARHWVVHARFQDVASRLKTGMETLFDSDKPHFIAWIGLYDMDSLIAHRWFLPNPQILPESKPNPLYYSVLCGLYDLVKHLVIKYPEHVNANYGRYGFPLVAALEEDHIEVAGLLLEHGANPDVRDTTGETPLLRVLSQRQRNPVNKVRLLLKYAADVNAHGLTLRSPLHLAEYNGELEVAQILVKHTANLNSPDNRGKTPLHILLERRMNNEDNVLNHTRFLLDHGAEVNRRNKENQTPLLLAMGRGWFKLVRCFLEYGADANTEDDNGKTPLHLLLERWMHSEDDVFDHARLLLWHGAEVNRRDKDNQTPLLLAMVWGWFGLAQILLVRGADANAEDNNGKTPWRIMLERQIYDKSVVGDVLNLTKLCLEHGAGANRRYKDEETPSPLEIGTGIYKFTCNLLSVTQMLPLRAKQARPQSNMYHEARMAPRNIVSVLHNYYPSVVRTSMRKTRAT